VQVDVNGYLLIKIEDFAGVAGNMLSPKGNLVSPVGFDPSGKIIPLQVTADGYLRVSASGLTEDIQDIVGAMMDGGDQSGIIVAYDDAGGVIDFTVPPSPSTQVYGGNGQTATVPGGASRYITPFVNGLIAGGYNCIMPVAGTLSVLQVRTNSAQPGSGNMVVVIQKNNVGTAVTLTIAAGAAAGDFSDITHSVHFDVGDTVRCIFTNNAAGASAQVTPCTWLYEND
jgi:hypothetical protein